MDWKKNFWLSNRRTSRHHAYIKIIDAKVNLISFYLKLPPIGILYLLLMLYHFLYIFLHYIFQRRKVLFFLMWMSIIIKTFTANINLEFVTLFVQNVHVPYVCIYLFCWHEYLTSWAHFSLRSKPVGLDPP